MKRIGVFTSGGDAPGMNAAIRAVVRQAHALGVEVIGIRRGYAGMIQGEMVPLGVRDVANIIQRGGTILLTARSQEFLTEEGRAKAYAKLQAAGIEGLVAIGGDGTFRGALCLVEEHGMPVVGVPGTIDNDLYGTDYTIGFDTAVNTALGGHRPDPGHRGEPRAGLLHRGHGAARRVHRPGRGACRRGGGHRRPRGARGPQGRGRGAGGLPEAGEEELHRGGGRGAYPGGAAGLLAAIREHLQVEARVTVLGHIQRGGSPTAKDRILASRLGAAAVEALVGGASGVMVGEVEGEVDLTP